MHIEWWNIAIQRCDWTCKGWIWRLESDKKKIRIQKLIQNIRKNDHKMAVQKHVKEGQFKQGICKRSRSTSFLHDKCILNNETSQSKEVIEHGRVESEGLNSCNKRWVDLVIQMDKQLTMKRGKHHACRKWANRRRETTSRKVILSKKCVKWSNYTLNNEKPQS